MHNLQSLWIFLRVVERGGFTAAASQLGLPLSTVSRRVTALEEDLGVRLLNRTTRRVSLTEAGRDFYERCSLAEEILEEADLSVRALRTEPEGTLRLLVPYALGLIALEPALEEFRRRYPRIRLALTFDNHPLDLVEHGFDVALRTGVLPDSSYVARRLGRSRARLLASPSYLDRAGRPASPQELSNHAVLAHGPGEFLTTWRLRSKAGAEVEVAVRPILMSNESDTIIRQMLKGAGIALVSTRLMANRAGDQSFEIVLPDWHRAEDAEVWALYSKRATRDRKIQAFVEFAAEIFAPWTRDPDEEAV
ncbi:LysR family transcriptional regulator [Labrys sp. (in: a-proteobacteria)]|uniref:LysR family transcriptional regulator n=1 Tax=Labrys sp. (in: a-proteobacteria) TaxID=1917972 RepID=UPI0039E5E3AA